uniref:Uncharacterized protein n=1 Tax=Oryza glumipatula TaxID=40148 RepID=A0A0D9ZHD0_9ORYZ
MQTDNAGELVRDAKTLWEKFRDGIVGTNQEVMAAVDSLRRKEGTRMVCPVPHMPPARPHMIPQMAPDVPTSHWQGEFAPFAGTNQGIPTIPQLSADFIGQGGFTSLGGPTQSVPLHAPTYGTNPWQGQSMDYGGTSFGGGVQGYMDFLQQDDWLFGQYSSHPNEIPYMQPPSTGDMSSFGGGSSSVPNELRTSQTDYAPHVTQPTQPEVGEGNDNDPCRSNRELHEPNRLSLSGPRHAAGARKKTTKKRAGTSRTTTDHDDDDE